jgi:hypothetical protein
VERDFREAIFLLSAGRCFVLMREFFKGCSAAFVARASDMPLCGVLGV